MGSHELLLSASRHDEMTPETLEGEIRFTAENTFGRAMTKRVISERFGIPQKFVTNEDCARMRKFAVHTGIQFLTAKLFGARSLDGDRTIRNRVDVIKDLNAYHEDIARHDISHIIWKAIVTNCKDVVPNFLTENSQVGSETLLRQEIGSSLFSVIYPGVRTNNVLVALMSPAETEKIISIVKGNIRAVSGANELLDPYIVRESLEHNARLVDVLSSIQHNSFESVFHAFQMFQIIAVRGETLKDYVKPKDASEFKKQYDAMAENVMKRPDPIAVDIARKIFNGHSRNPRVVMDIFLERCAPILKSLNA